MPVTSTTQRLFPPVLLPLVAVATGLCITFFVVLAALSQPWLGLTLQADSEQDIRITAIAPDSPADRAGLSVGDRIVAVGNTNLIPVDLIEEPDMLADYSALDAFLARQGGLHDALTRSDGARLTTPAAEVTVQPASWRPLQTLPLVFWVQVGVGLFGFWVGAWVLATRKGGQAEAFLFTAGAGLLISAQAAAIYSTRELALDPGLFATLSALNHLGALGFGAGMIGLFLCYPVQLVRGAWSLLPALVLGLWWLANRGRLFSDPLIAFQLPIVLALVVIGICVAIQWRATASDPRRRAALRWFGLAVLIGAGAFIVTIILPILLGFDAALSQGFAFLFFLPIYGGLALGVVRYRLFELETWGFRILFYMGGVVLLVVLDAALIIVITMDRAPAFGVALLLVGLLYLPMRDTLARRLLSQPRQSDGRLFRAIADVALTPPGESRAARWDALLRSEFDPLRIEPLHPAPPRPCLTDDGAALDLPAIDTLPGRRLQWAQGGRALFSARDLAHAEEVAAMFAETTASRRAYESGVAEERNRIAQDIHDNIGIQLMGALHSGNPDRKDALIREALSDLRDITSNANRADLPLFELLADLRGNFGETLAAAGLALHWNMPTELPGRLEPRQAHALRSLLREAVGNALRHAQATSITITSALQDGILHLMVEDDGKGMATSGNGTRPGNGLGNMKARAQAMGGSVTVDSVAGQGTRVTASLPLSANGRFQ